ncbi:hypothetical protein ACPPVT_02805 [Angustibacter sp. McL0619]|uniref:hypothetical protein n=1 Tax=Angustibacter sp. McL0619 TaxID=3415676 RepID=UPI003CF8D077
MIQRHTSRSVRLGRRRIVTLVGDPAQFPVLLRAMDTSTPKRRAVRSVLRTAGALRLLALVGRRPDDAEWAQIEESLAQAELVEDAPALAVFWPAGDRAHRRYLLAVGGRGGASVFVKVSTAAEVDERLLANEHQVLAALQVDPLRDWRTPVSYGLRRSGTQVSLAVQALPAQRGTVTWELIEATLPLRRTSDLPPRSARPVELDWWLRARRHPSSAEFEKTLRVLDDQQVPVGLVNGDIRPSNAITGPDGGWLFDWEFADFSGPLNADVVGASLNRIGADALTEPVAEVVERMRSAARRHGCDEFDVVLALMYLSSVEHPGALRLRASWPGSSEH